MPSSKPIRTLGSRKLIPWIFVFLALLLAGCATPMATAEPTPTAVVAVPDAPSEDAVRVAVLTIRSAVAANSQYGPILSYLSEQIGRPFVLVPVTQDGQFTAVANQEVAFTFNNPLAAAQIQRLYRTEFLATLDRANTGPYFAGLIVVRADSPIVHAEDLRGKRVTCVDFETAAAGCVFQIYHLRQQGIDAYKDFASFTETASQDNIVLGVLNGTFDAGFIRTGQLEGMIRDGTLLHLDEMRVVDPMDDGFFFPHTTKLYPEWPFAALASTDPTLAAQVKAALLAIPKNDPAMINAGGVGFVDAIDYTPLHELIEGLQLYSYESPRP